MSENKSEQPEGAHSPDRVSAGVMTRIVPGVVDVVVIAPSEATRNTIVKHSAVAHETAANSAGDRVASDYWRVLTLKRGPNTRCTGAWEIVHGRIEGGERAEQAAVREVMEETGLTITRLYSITVNAFYLHQTGTVQLALVFAAVVDVGDVSLGAEHDEFAWRDMAGASEILAWPREREALAHVQQLLRTGNAGPVEDVLRII